MLAKCFACLPLRRPDQRTILVRESDFIRPPLSSQEHSIRPSSPSTKFGPWHHPLETFVNMAAHEPDCLMVSTLESGELQQYTYRQVWDRAYSIAQGLKELEVWSPGLDVVGLHCEPEAHWVFFTLALWILGKKPIYFALNWSASVRKIVSDRLRVRVILYACTKPGRIDGVQAIDGTQFPLLNRVPFPSLEICAPVQECIAYAATSGTTGVPRTYPIPHRAAISVVDNWPRLYGSMGVTQAPSFGGSGLGTIVPTPYLKGSLWFPKPTQSVTERARELMRLFDAGLEIAFMTPSFVKFFFKIVISDRQSAQWPFVTRIIMGGEVIQTSVVDLVKRHMPNASIRCVYGSAETSIIQLFVFSTIEPQDPTPETIVYTANNPKHRCILLDEQGRLINTVERKRGILGFALPKDDPIQRHPNFQDSDNAHPLTAFGFLDDGSPRVCTMDEVELLGENKFTVIGRYGRKVRVNDTVLDLQMLEDQLLKQIGTIAIDCSFVLAPDSQIVLLYAPKKVSGTPLTSKQILDMVETIFKYQNLPKFSISRCLELEELPFSESGKRDMQILKNIVARADVYELATSFPLLPSDISLRTQIARKVSHLGCCILEIALLDGRDYDICSVGFDSILTARLSLTLKDEYGVDVNPFVLLSPGVTPLQIADMIVEATAHGKMAPRLPTLDLAKEVAKYDDKTVSGASLQPFRFSAAPNKILLTGATGFLGSFILSELMASFPRSKIACLVRAADDTEATQRLWKDVKIATMSASPRENSGSEYSERIEAYAGNLSSEHWGLSPEKWRHLAESVELIIHLGAEVYRACSYDKLVKTNVLGTLTALRLATTCRLKAVHYISTMDALPWSTKASQEIFQEKMYSDWSVSGGYAQTKWVAEHLVDRAHARGVPATIIRPSGIVGDTIFGVCNKDEYIWKYVKGCIQLGVVPVADSNVNLNLDPVDYVAKAVVAIAGSQAALDQYIFHINDPMRRFTEEDLFQIVLDMGWPIRFDTRETFEQLTSSPDCLESHSLLPLLHYIPRRTFVGDNAHTRSVFASAGPPMFKAIRRSLAYLVEAGYLPVPPTQRAQRE
ncbi:male sterility protein-domain-containing protein [Polychytrium aggregatum]|uniref:male sterility protein-domain-containing protein n=1 Tax=Polychytrium aggregatum TaxID=110093 RepID=UPI0022FEABB9|nr:male sterility protein-domain-containing protein [Polychytrium aggregatum]KAI9205028.1 male sterility protein-domain-containing protein [Polychytrium aggregatum]